MNFYPNIDRKGRVEIIISTPAATERRLAYEASEEYKMIKARKRILTAKRRRAEEVLEAYELSRLNVDYIEI